MAIIQTTRREAVRHIVETYCNSSISQGKNTQEQRAKLLATDQPILRFVARMLEVYADMDDWTAWAEQQEGTRNESGSNAQPDCE